MTETTTEPTTSDEIRELLQTAMDAMLTAGIKAAGLADHKFNKMPLERIRNLISEGRAHFLGAMSELASVATNAEGDVSDANAN